MTHLREYTNSVVNAANNSLLGGGGIDGAIHSAAGSYLKDYNAKLGGCETGQTKISPGFKLPAKWILSTVGPIGENEKLLRSCYQTCLNLVEKHSIKSVGFCCVSTGIFGYPLKNATRVALDTVRKWLEKDDNYKKVDRIIFVVFLDKEEAMYDTLVPYYFPLKPEEEEVKQEEVKQEEVKQEEEKQEDKKEYAEESKKGESSKSVEEERIVNEEEKPNEQTKEQVRKEQKEEKNEDMKD
jgi:O-acetyl-ADP-ribose deacetylase (regulator of RNase III)